MPTGIPTDMSVALRETGIQTVAIEIVSEIGSNDRVLISSDIMGTTGDARDLAAGTVTTDDVHDLAAETLGSSRTIATGASAREATTEIGTATGSTQARGTIRGTTTIATAPTHTETARGITMTGAVRGDVTSLAKPPQVTHDRAFYRG
jgi:hypothetical protein